MASSPPHDPQLVHLSGGVRAAGSGLGSVRHVPTPLRSRSASAETSRSPLWLWPLASAAAAVLAAVALSRLRPEGDGFLMSLPISDVAAAQALLQVTATSVMTATALTFSVTVVTLQLASQQFSPRLLREFTRDRVTKSVLSVLATSFVFAVTVLPFLDQDEPVPRAAVMVAAVLAVAALVAILAFTTHIARSVRVDTMMRMVHEETSRAIDRFYPAYGDASVRSPADLPPPAGPGTMITAAKSGFVQLTDVDRLVRWAEEHDALVRIEVRAGDQIIRGTPIATAWRAGGDQGLSGPDAAAVAARVRDAVMVGYERTMDQDTAFGFRQLEDIAVKAMSPSVNDPVTAAHAVGHMADLLVSLTGRHLGPAVHHDDGGAPRAIVPDRDIRYYLDLSCSQLRRFAAAEPSVLIALLRMLRDVAVACRDDHQRTEIRRAAELVAAQAQGMQDADEADLRDMVRRIEEALAGRVQQAYGDRSGETRST